MGDAGILFVVSAGNEAVFNDIFPVYPSSYVAPNLISVAASGGGGTRAFFSNFGEATVNVTAPGEYILRAQVNDESGDGGGVYQCCWTTAHVKVVVK